MLLRNTFDSIKSRGSVPAAAFDRHAAHYVSDTLEGRCMLSAVSLRVSDAAVVEGNGGTRTAAVVVSLNASSAKTVSVNFSTSNGTAAAGGDYDAASGKLTFAPGEIRKSVLVPVRGDRVAEPDESFLVKLSGAKNATVGDGSGAVSVLDDEPRIRVLDAQASEGSSGTTPLTFTVSLSSAYDQAVTVDYATADGAATTADADYVAASGALTFAPGETRRTVTVQLVGDTRPEPQESFFLNLGRASANAIVDRGQGSGAILDDELRIYATAQPAWEGSELTFQVWLTAASAEVVTVNFATSDGTASAGEDYVAMSGTLTFAPGETTKTVTVATLRDYVPEAMEEIFYFNLTGVSANAITLTGQGFGGIDDMDGGWGGYGDLYGGW